MGEKNIQKYLLCFPEYIPVSLIVKRDKNRVGDKMPDAG